MREPDWKAVAAPELGVGPLVSERIREFREWLLSIPSDTTREFVLGVLFTGICRECASESPCSCRREE